MRVLLLLVAALLLCSPAQVGADPGAINWTVDTAGTGAVCSWVSGDRKCYYVVPVASTTSSAIIEVQGGNAMVCAATATTGTYTIVIASYGDVDSQSISPGYTLSSATSGCRPLYRGDRAHIDVSSAPTGSPDVITIRGF